MSSSQPASSQPASSQSRIYAIDSDQECQRLELQARLSGVERHLPLLAVPEGGRVVDIGCGSGSMARAIARAHPKAEVVGVDIRPNYLEFARAKAAEEGLGNVRFVEADVFALPFEDGAFDTLWSKYLFQWLKDPAPAIAEAARVIRPGGQLVSADLVDFVVEHHPADPGFDAEARRVMPQFVDVGIGRRIAPRLLALGFADVAVTIETDRLFTVIGAIDPERRWNWEVQWRAARPRLVQILGGEAAADAFIESFFRHHDDPMTCTFTALYLTRGTKTA